MNTHTLTPVAHPRLGIPGTIKGGYFYARGERILMDEYLYIVEEIDDRPNAKAVTGFVFLCWLIAILSCGSL